MKIHVRNFHNFKLWKWNYVTDILCNIGNDDLFRMRTAVLRHARFLFYILFDFGFDYRVGFFVLLVFVIPAVIDGSSFSLNTRISDCSHQSSVSSVVIGSARLCRALPPLKLLFRFEYNAHIRKLLSLAKYYYRKKPDCRSLEK